MNSNKLSRKICLTLILILLMELFSSSALAADLTIGGRICCGSPEAVLTPEVAKLCVQCAPAGKQAAPAGAASAYCSGVSVTPAESKDYPNFNKLADADNKRIEAEQLLAEAKSLRSSYNPNNWADAKYKEGNARKLAAEALQSYSELLKSNPDDTAAALIGIGQINRIEGNYDSAIQNFRDATLKADKEQYGSINSAMLSIISDRETNLKESSRQQLLKSGGREIYRGTEEQTETLMRAFIQGRREVSDAMSDQARASVQDYLSASDNMLSLCFTSPVKAFRLFPYPSISGVDKFEGISQRLKEQSSAINTVLDLEGQGIVRFTDLNSIDEAKLSEYAAKTGVPAFTYKAQIDRVKNSDIYKSMSLTPTPGNKGFTLAVGEADIAKLKSSTALVEGGRVIRVADVASSIFSPCWYGTGEVGAKMLSSAHGLLYSKNILKYAAATDYLKGLLKKPLGAAGEFLSGFLNKKTPAALTLLSKTIVGPSLSEVAKSAEDMTLMQLAKRTGVPETLQCLSAGNPFAYAADIHQRVAGYSFLKQIRDILSLPVKRETIALRLRALARDTILKDPYNPTLDQSFLLKLQNTVFGIDFPNNPLPVSRNQAVLRFYQGKGDVKAASVFVSQSRQASSEFSESFELFTLNYQDALKKLKDDEMKKVFLAEAEQKAQQARIARIDSEFAAVQKARHDFNNPFMGSRINMEMFGSEIDPTGYKEISGYMEKLIESIQASEAEQVSPVLSDKVFIHGEKVYQNLVPGDLLDVYAGQIPEQKGLLTGKAVSKAVVYLDHSGTSGTYEVVHLRAYISHQDAASQLVRKDLFSHRDFLWELADTAERAQIRSQGEKAETALINKITQEVLKGDYKRAGILKRIACYQSQLDPQIPQLTFTFQGATATDRQLHAKIMLSPDFNKALEDSISRALYPNGLKIDAPPGLLAGS